MIPKGLTYCESEAGMAMSSQELDQDSEDFRGNEFGLAFGQLVLTLGYRCNMLCKSCFIGDKLFDDKTALTYEEAIQIIESAARLQTIRSVAFVGGEPFVYYKLMLRIAAYVHRHYRCPLNVTTNGSWAKTHNSTRRLLDPLHDLGLGWLMLSLDQYHLEFGAIDQASNCLERALELDINTSVQVIRRKGAPRAKDFCEALKGRLDVSRVQWIENPCSAIGNAKTMLRAEDLEWHEDIPPGGCNAGEILNIQPDGEIKPCCGAGLMSKRLSLGNAKHQMVHEQVHRAEADSLINCLIANQGPRGLARLLRDAGRGDLVDRHAPFTDACHACHAFLSDPETLQVLESILKGREVEMLADRVLSVHGHKILRALEYA